MGRAIDQVARAAEPLLEPGETVEIATIATFGRTSIAKAAAIAAATTIATGGLLTTYAYAKKVPIVLTTRRFLVLGIKGLIFEKAGSNIVTELARDELRAHPPRQHLLWTKVDLTDAEGFPVARLQFPLPYRGDAHRMAQLLGEPPFQVVGLGGMAG